MTEDAFLLMEKLKLIARRSDGGLVEVAVWVSTPPPLLKVRAEDHAEELSYEDVDLFECLTRARLDLESRGLLLCCQGARPNVFPSGLLRQMTDGRNAYQLSEHKAVSDDDLVDVLAPAPCSETVSVSDQKAVVLGLLRSVFPNLKAE